MLDRTAEQLLKSETLNQPEIELVKKQIIGELPPQAAMAAATGLLAASS